MLSIRTNFGCWNMARLPHSMTLGAMDGLHAFVAIAQPRTELILDTSPTREGMNLMAARKVSKQDRDWYSGRWTWNECRLSQSDKQAFEDWQENTNVPKAIQGVFEEGYQIQMTWDVKSQAYLAVLRYPFLGHGDTGWAMSTRAPELYEALMLSMYKFLVVLKGTLSKGGAGSTDSWG